MSNIYIGVDEKARNIEKMYIGVQNKARLVQKVYLGVNEKAQRIWPPPTTRTISYNITSQSDYSGEGDFLATWTENGYTWQCSTVNGVWIYTKCQNNIKIISVSHSGYPNAQWRRVSDKEWTADIDGTSVLGTITYTYQEL